MEYDAIIWDNDGTLTKTKSGLSFKEEISKHLEPKILEEFSIIMGTTNIDEVKLKLSLFKKQNNWGYSDIASNVFGISKKYFLEKVRASLKPVDHVQPRGQQKIIDILNSKNNHHMITGAPACWFESCMLDVLGIDPNLQFKSVHTKEKFHTKDEVIEKLIIENNYNPKHILAIGDEKKDIEYIKKLGGDYILVDTF